MGNGCLDRATVPWRAVLVIGFYILVGSFLAFFLQDVDWTRLSRLDPSWPFLALALPFSLLVRFLQPPIWAVLLRDYGASTPSYWALTLVYAKSWLGRYIPGKVAWIGSKILFGSRYGIKRGVLGVTAVLEAGLQLTTGLGLGLLLFTAFGGSGILSPVAQLGAAIALVGVIVCIVPRHFNAIVRRIHRHVKGSELSSDLQLSNEAFRKVVVSLVGVHAIGLIPVFLVLKAVYPALPLEDLPYVGAASLLAGSAGSLVLIAPSGIGVREGVLIPLLALVMPTEIAVVAVVGLRIWSVVMDLLYYALASSTVYFAEQA